MPEVQCMKYPLKPGCRETVVNWIANLANRTAELLEAMAEGGLVAETVFLGRSASGDHILIYTNAENLQAGMESLSKSNLPLIQEFNQLMSENVDLEKASALDLIFHTPDACPPEKTGNH